jgi:hypothetical protein
MSVALKKLTEKPMMDKKHARCQSESGASFDPIANHTRVLVPLLRKSSFALRARVKEGKLSLIVSHRSERITTKFHPETGAEKTRRYRLHDIGSIRDEALHVTMPILRIIVASVRNEDGIPLGLEAYLRPGVLTLGLKLPVNDEAGAKIGLLCRLQSRAKDMARIELMAHRIARFSREEALYWLSRTTLHEREANSWAVSGLKIMLCGHGGEAVIRMLEKVRAGH